MARAEAESLIEKGINELSLPHDKRHTGLFMTYLSELKKWNKAYSLTSLKTDEDIITKHFLDSLLFLKAMPEGRISVMDAGSGAGFPGIPIKIMRPEIESYLVEPTRKKAAFLRHIISTLGLKDIEVIEKRIENLEAMDVDVAVTRALFDIKDFCKKASPVLERRGLLILNKGPKVNEELKAIEKNDIDCKVSAVKLPFTDIKRFIVIIRKKNHGVAHEADNYASQPVPKGAIICINAECRLRKAGCRGFEWCPGFKSRETE